MGVQGFLETGNNQLIKNVPLGFLQQKALVAANFLKRKLAEHERLQREIESLRREIGKT